MVAENELFGVNGGAAADDFVDELLDFSNGFGETEELEEPEEKATETAKTAPVFCQEAIPAAENISLSGEEDFAPPHESDLIQQAEGLESLEWLSHFVEESFCDYSLAGKFPPGAAENKPEMAAPVTEQPCFAAPVQTKARTKRARAGVRVWPVQRRSRIQGPNLSPSFADSSTSSSSSTTSFPPPHAGPTNASSLKKPKRKPADVAAATQQRRCSHCGVTKTPQWRAGPLGSKTLCNACGVRFKSGRLLPEYRPACSPTFSSEIHSNSHRKVLEMRRKKELEVGAAGPQPVQSF